MRSRARRGLAGLLSTAVAASGLVALGVAGAPAASAAPAQVTNATFTWDINNEVNAGAFAPGTWNLMSAGRIGNPGAGGATLKSADNGATWNNGAAAGWKNTDGNVTIEDKAADGSYGPTTFQGTRTNSAGQTTSGASQTILAETRLVVRNGVGTLDPATDNATITWDGDATVLFYSGMTYFTLSDPKLTLTGGAGTVTATLGGYATSMDDPTKWEAVPEATVALATLSGVDVTSTGLTATPAYREVPYTAPASSSPQVTSGANWGSFPQAFVDFQQVLGQGPYWYSTGGSADPRKVANPLSVGFSEHKASVQVSRTTLLPSGAQEVTVTGSGFTPSLSTGTRPPLSGRPAGTYVVFGKFAEVWKPSLGTAAAPSANRAVGSQKWAVAAADMATIGGANSGAVELKPDGTFTTTLTVNKPALDATATASQLVNYGIYTYGGSGASAPAFETYTPVTFAQATPAVAVSAPSVAQGLPAAATVTVSSTTGVAATGNVTLSQGDTVVGTQPLDGTGKATFDLGASRPVGTYPLSASYAGDANFLTATGTGSLIVAAPSVTLSRSTFVPNGAQTVTVTGTGFNPAAATGTRPPLAGKPSGSYVVFGKFAENWKPSAGAATATRVNSSQKWAVLAEDMATIGGPDGGAVELKPDGSFTATLTVDKAAIDAVATAATLVNYGIYTYGGSGGTVAAYETYTPVTFAQATPTVTVTAPPARPGVAASATVTVSSTTGVAATGNVTLSQGDTVVGTQPLDGTGKATFDLGASRPVGTYPLSASYAGDSNFSTRTGAGTFVVANPAVEVSRSTFVPNGAQTVTVTGTGFNPAAATGTRPPLAGKPSGSYVVFGKFAENWKPSAGAATATRVNSSQKWAVLAEDMATIGGPDGGAVELKPDGSFTATLTVDKAAIDAVATAATLVNYGIYTYGGSGGTVAAYETYTPVTFAQATPTVTVTAPSVSFGAVATATVEVTGDGDNTGSVTLAEGTTELGTAVLEDGKATFDLGTALGAGDHELTATYTGDANTTEGTGRTTLVVAPGTATVTLSVPARTYGQVSTAIVTVAGTGATGEVTLSRAGRVVGKTDLQSGRATFSLGELAAGRHALTASYAGNGNVAAATATGSATVAKATSRAKLQVTKKPTRTRAGKVRATITTTPAGSATGKVKLVLRNAKGKAVRTVSARLNARGVATATLPKLAKGRYRVVLTYAATANVKASTKTATLRVS
ncbi:MULTISPECIES: beta strand repeat-containing protein [unclassified Nocardioides]|uniref:beta strand repeat-containing protein n=1 Tax=unclassified Nocardioides TaxID=2615069 RepID=UPI00301513AB